MIDRNGAAILALCLGLVLLAGCAGDPADPGNGSDTTEDPDEPDDAEGTARYEVDGPADETRSISGNLGGFSPENLTVPAGSTVTVTYNNTGSQGHNFGVDVDGDGETEDDARTETLSPGESGSVTFRIPDTGDYAFYCDVPTHRNQGMEGTLTVE